MLSRLTEYTSAVRTFDYPSSDRKIARAQVLDPGI